MPTAWRTETEPIGVTVPPPRSLGPGVEPFPNQGARKLWKAGRLGA